jgi:hypothetical protein
MVADKAQLRWVWWLEVEEKELGKVPELTLAVLAGRLGATQPWPHQPKQAPNHGMTG